MPSFRVIQGCPVFSDIAPHIAITLDGAHAPVSSIYRGDDARAILHKHGKHSQYELYHATPAQRRDWGILGTPDEPGRSTHELRSDGVAYPHIPVGARLEWWMQGFDVPAEHADACIHFALRYGWHLMRPYHAGVELHHLNFAVQPLRPVPGTRLWAEFWKLRLYSLPRS